MKFLKINPYMAQWIDEWCRDNGWTDWFVECSRYWAFPPNAVIPVPIPNNVLQTIKLEKGLSHDEKLWGVVAVVSAIAGLLLTYFQGSPMPLLAAFTFCAITVARMENELDDLGHTGQIELP